MMLVDCQTCPVRDVHCADCMVTTLTAIPVGPPESVTRLRLDRAERRAVSILLGAGLVTAETANQAHAVTEHEMTPPRMGRTAV
jgi:hypothetical protein